MRHGFKFPSLAFMARQVAAPALDQAEDDFEGYADSQTVNGLSGGIGWVGGYTAESIATGSESFESYTDGSDANALDGGTGWSGTWTAVSV